MRLALHQGRTKKLKAAKISTMDKPVLSDPVLAVIAYKRPRFYLFSSRCGRGP